jgi:hypothetical protein
LEDFMVVKETPVYNSANLALFMVNVSQALMRPRVPFFWNDTSILAPFFHCALSGYYPLPPEISCNRGPAAGISENFDR